MRSSPLTRLRLGIALLLLAPCVSSLALAQAAPDCTVSPKDTANTQVICAIQHANFLYAQICQTNRYCGSQDPQLLDAYASAARLYNRTHTVNAKANDACWSGFLLERAHAFAASSSSYLVCISLATKEQNAKLGQSCATRLTVVHCALDATAPACQRSGPQIVTISSSSGGGTVASAIEADDQADPQAEAKPAQAGPISTAITMPDRKDIEILGQSMSAQQKQAARAVIRSQKLTLDSAKTKD